MENNQHRSGSEKPEGSGCSDGRENSLTLTDDEILEFWDRMTHIYGHRWSSSYGSEPNDTWVMLLTRLSRAEVAEGVKACISRFSGWPPTLPEFRNLCLQIPDQDTAVRNALDDHGGKIALQMRGTLTSWDRQHMTRESLERHYRSVYEQCAQEYVESLLALELVHPARNLRLT